jgi:hypothetical protein
MPQYNPSTKIKKIEYANEKEKKLSLHILATVCKYN